MMKFWTTPNSVLSFAVISCIDSLLLLWTRRKQQQRMDYHGYIILLLLIGQYMVDTTSSLTSTLQRQCQTVKKGPQVDSCVGMPPGGIHTESMCYIVHSIGSVIVNIYSFTSTNQLMTLDSEFIDFERGWLHESPIASIWQEFGAQAKIRTTKFTHRCLPSSKKNLLTRLWNQWKVL